MATAKAQRTLVKSPPELWCELGDAAALERHLSDLGEIRITRCEPEQLLEWQAPKARGTIELKASGWGTKVLLSLTREQEPPARASADPEPERRPEENPEQPSRPQPGERPAPSEAFTAAAEAQDPQPAAQPAAAEEPDWPAIAERRTGQRLRVMWAQLRRSLRRSKAQTERQAGEGAKEDDRQPQDCTERDAFAGLAEAALAQSAAPQRQLTPAEAPASTPAEGPADPFQSPDQPTAQFDPIPAFQSEADASGDCDAQQVEAILTGLLDRLGEAHHRPFSRA